MHCNLFNEIPIREIAPGFFSRIIHTEHNTINFIEVAAGCQLPKHQHPHHQSSFVLSGTFEMIVGEATYLLTPEKYCLIPGGVIHGGTAITDCKILDVFSPVREDYR